MSKNLYTVVFAGVMCLVLSLLLSVTSMSLRDLQQANIKIDQQKNILEAAGIVLKNTSEVQKTFESRVESFVLDRLGNRVPDMAADEVDIRRDKEHFPLYRVKKPGGTDETLVYVYPVIGQGLWSKLYGYLAVTKDGREVRGLTFYAEGETPGLGKEIIKPWFRDNFVGKALYQGARLVGIDVVKGKARDHSDYKKRKEHLVDGISGATITGNGVSRMLKTDPRKYAPFFAKGAES